MAVTYTKWLHQVARGAMKREWCIDEDEDYWRPKWKRELTPEQALEELWSDLRKDYEMSQEDSWH